YFHGGERDWPVQNWLAARRREPGAGFKFFAWDTEDFIFDVNDRTGVNLYNSPAFLYSQLRANAEFRLRFADRVHKHFFNDGRLTPEAARDAYLQLADRIDEAIVAESARWGDYRRDVYSYGQPGHVLYTRDDHWQVEVDDLVKDQPGHWFTDRTQMVLNQLRAANLYPSIDAPSFNEHGGQVPDGFQLDISASAGTVYYTLDGSDPRMPGAMTFDGNPITLNETATLKARLYDNGTWSALNEATFFAVVPADAASLAITELNYNPTEPTDEEAAVATALGVIFNNDDFEFVELRNAGATTVDLAGVRFGTGITFEFPTEPMRPLAPGESVVVVANTDAFAARYGDQFDG
ncbi:hypothetical protein LCGC14_3082220, partial [marine sediment metagenome]